MSEAVPFPKPGADPLQAPFWTAAAEGRLAFQRCYSCAHAFLPGRSECPSCLGNDLAWEDASGTASLVSWVGYHRAFHPAFANRLPYTVAIVELAEGPRMITNIVGPADGAGLRIEMPLQLVIEEEEGQAVPRFRPVAG